MKKIIGILAAVGVALALVGCDTVGVNGNPVDMTGTWTNVSQSVDNSTDTTPAVNGYEGTWSYHSVSYPTPASTASNADNTVTTTTYYDTTTHTVDSSMVIAADGSYVKTTTITDDRAARATIAAVTTGAAQTAGSAEVVAQKVVYTEVETVTVVADGLGYKQTTVTTKTEVRTGGATGFAGTTTKTDTAVAYKSTPGSLAFNTLSFTVTDFAGSLFYSGQNASANYTIQTVKGTTKPAISGIASTTVTTTVLAILEDGSYTKTTTVLNTIPEQAAVAATSTTSAKLAVAAGTRTTTIVETGLVTSNTTTSQQGATPTATAYFVPAASNVTRIATGSGINAGSVGSNNYDYEYGETAVTTAAAFSNWSAGFYIVKGSGQTAKTNLILGSTVYAKS
jgi:hypothetical protein